jgi:two-component system NtrC family response regulator
MEEVERRLIQRALHFYDNNRQQAAKALGIGRKTLYRKIEKYDLG